MFKKFFYLIVLCAVSWPPLEAMTYRRTEVHRDDDDDDDEEIDEEEDVWFGPGFYFGIWFDNEDEYRHWRHNHRDYPSNRHYYNRDHPVEYHHDGGGHQGEGHSGGGHGGGHK